MIYLIIASITAVLFFYFIIRKITGSFSGKNFTNLSDANYLLKKDIDLSRNRALQLNQSLKELHSSTQLLQEESDTMLSKQYDLLNYQKENLKKWSDEAKN
jgi:hypothetical protein